MYYMWKLWGRHSSLQWYGQLCKRYKASPKYQSNLHTSYLIITNETYTIHLRWYNSCIWCEENAINVMLVRVYHFRF